METALAAIFTGAIGKVLAALLALGTGVLGGWIASRANIMAAVNARVEGLMAHLEREIDRLTHAHAECEERQRLLKSEVELIRGELRNTKQTLESVQRARQP